MNPHDPNSDLRTKRPSREHAELNSASYKDQKLALYRTANENMMSKQSRNLAKESSRLHQVTDTTKRTSELPSVLTTSAINESSDNATVTAETNNNLLTDGGGSMRQEPMVRRPW